jgi:hypothetical protein
MLNVARERVKSSRITGGGFRQRPAHSRRLRASTQMAPPPIFDWLQRHGEVADDEMRRVSLRHRNGRDRALRQASDVIDRRAVGERVPLGVIAEPPTSRRCSSPPSHPSS